MKTIGFSCLMGYLVLTSATTARQVAPPLPPQSALPLPQQSVPPSTEQTNYQNIGTMSQLMIDIIYPTSDDIFYIGRTPLDTDADWGMIQRSALMLAESGNLLLLPGRARDQGDWVKDAKLLIDAGTAAYKAAKAKDIKALEMLNAQLYAACVTCHQQYRSGFGRRR